MNKLRAGISLNAVSLKFLRKKTQLIPLLIFSSVLRSIVLLMMGLLLFSLLIMTFGIAFGMGQTHQDVSGDVWISVFKELLSVKVGEIFEDNVPSFLNFSHLVFILIFFALYVVSYLVMVWLNISIYNLATGSGSISHSFRQVFVSIPKLLKWKFLYRFLIGGFTLINEKVPLIDSAARVIGFLIAFFVVPFLVLEKKGLKDSFTDSRKMADKLVNSILFESFALEPLFLLIVGIFFCFFGFLYYCGFLNLWYAMGIFFVTSLLVSSIFNFSNSFVSMGLFYFGKQGKMNGEFSSLKFIINQSGKPQTVYQKIEELSDSVSKDWLTILMSLGTLPLGILSLFGLGAISAYGFKALEYYAYIFILLWILTIILFKLAWTRLKRKKNTIAKHILYCVIVILLLVFFWFRPVFT